MQKKKIVYICGFSNNLVRERLNLKSYNIRNFIYSLFGREKTRYIDFAIWNTAFITEFEEIEGYEFHIISPHAGMKHKSESFVNNGVHYHFFKNNYSLLTDTIRSLTHYPERSNYRECRQIIDKILKTIQPKIVIVCGAEQPSFSPAILDIKDIPVYVLLETLVSNPALKSSMKYSEVFCKVESLVFPILRYIAAGKKYLNFVKGIQPYVQCLPISFPTYQPKIIQDCPKEFDFVFYASVLSKNKGVEDLLIAFKILHWNYPTATLLISGKCDTDYLSYLKSIVGNELFESQYIRYIGLCDNIEDKYSIVQTARYVVLPGITASLNSTVRESMLMGMPTIVYETTSTRQINQQTYCCLLEARMENVEDLASKMMYAYNHSEEMKIMGQNAKIYADIHFSNKIIANKLMRNAELVMDNYYQGIPIPDEFTLN